jgi:ABC-2 type transport system ATP-binding protein
MKTIEVRGLAKTYPGGAEAVQGIDFDVAPGEVFGLLGPNGAGKSTTVGMLTTTVEPSRGRALVAGFDVLAEPLAARRVSSVVFQEPVVDRGLTGRRNLEIHASLWGVERRVAARRIGELAGTLGLDGLLEREVGSYSGGERRRLEIARALVSRPRVLFLDEPSVGLDPRQRARLWEFVAALASEDGTTVIFSTHDIQEAERYGRRLLVLADGESLFDGPAEELREAVRSEAPEAADRDFETAFVAYLQHRGH